MMRMYFSLCLALGWALRSAKYSKARVVQHNGHAAVRKHRAFYAPLLIWMSGPLMRLLDTGVRVLPQHDWEERERRIYQSVYGGSIGIDSDGALILPCFAGTTLASVLDRPDFEERLRKWVIERAVIALADFHRLGFTHGDAMADNVMIDAGVARWFDFETLHESERPIAWRRADDVRALLVTCVKRTTREQRAEIVHLILDVYADDEVTRILAAGFSSLSRRSLTFHLAQAGLSLESFREICSEIEDTCRSAGKRSGSH